MALRQLGILLDKSGWACIEIQCTLLTKCQACPKQITCLLLGGVVRVDGEGIRCVIRDLSAWQRVFFTQWCHTQERFLGLNSKPCCKLGMISSLPNSCGMSSSRGLAPSVSCKLQTGTNLAASANQPSVNSVRQFASNGHHSVVEGKPSHWVSRSALVL